jgi:hypothetical protein
VNHGLEQVSVVGICFAAIVLFVFISISHDVNLAILRNTMAVISEAGSSYLFGAPDFNLMFLVSQGIVPAPLVEPIILVKRVGLVLSEYHHHLIELYFPLSLLICHMVLNNNVSLILTFLE